MTTVPRPGVDGQTQTVPAGPGAGGEARPEAAQLLLPRTDAGVAFQAVVGAAVLLLLLLRMVVLAPSAGLLILRGAH